jgi:predicted RNA binding protein YcfA (HicA-like mRNA interferase family)
VYSGCYELEPHITRYYSCNQERCWEHVATDGSHWQFKHPKKKGRVTVPHPKKSLGIKTIKSILKQAGLTSEEFEQCLK